MDRVLRWGRGYASRLSNRCWAAEVTGSSPLYGLSRRFLDAVRVEADHHGRARTILRYTYDLLPDHLYELSEEGDRWFVMCYTSKDGEQRVACPSAARSAAWVAALDAGQTHAEARRATKGM